MRCIVTGVMLVAIALPTIAFADDVKEGWGFQFRQDTFEKTVFPLAIMSEETKDFDKATLFVACAKDGSLIVAYSPSAIISFEQTVKVQFRGANSTKDFTFASVDIPHMGKFRGLSKDDSAALMGIFAASSGEVPFRTDKKQGVFTSIGAVETFKIVKAHCPGAKW